MSHKSLLTGTAKQRCLVSFSRLRRPQSQEMSQHAGNFRPRQTSLHERVTGSHQSIIIRPKRRLLAHLLCTECQGVHSSASLLSYPSEGHFPREKRDVRERGGQNCALLSSLPLPLFLPPLLCESERSFCFLGLCFAYFFLFLMSKAGFRTSLGHYPSLTHEAESEMIQARKRSWGQQKVSC